MVGLQADRVIGQKKLDGVLDQVRDELKLTNNEKVSGCDYQSGWYVVKTKTALLLVKNKKIFFADLGVYNDTNNFQRWPNITLQPTDSPAIDFYYLYKYCVW